MHNIQNLQNDQRRDMQSKPVSELAHQANGLAGFAMSGMFEQ